MDATESSGNPGRQGERESGTKTIEIDPLVELLVANEIVHGPTRAWIRTVEDARQWAEIRASEIRDRLVATS